jgi:chromosome segregation ATPase
MAATLRASTTSQQLNLEQQRTQTEQTEREVAECQAQLAVAQTSVESAQSALESAEKRAEDAESQLADLVEVERLLITAREEVDQLRASLAERSALEFGARQERDQAREERDAAKERIGVVEAELQAALEAQR